VYVADVIGKRLDMARELGAYRTIDAGKEDTVERIMALTGGRGVDLVFETAGSEVTARQTAEIVARGGEITLVGMSANPVFTYDFGRLQNKEAQIRTVFRYRNLYPAAIRIVKECGLPLKKIVTNYYTFEETEKAMEDSIHQKREMVKTVIRF